MNIKPLVSLLYVLRAASLAGPCFLAKRATASSTLDPPLRTSSSTRIITNFATVEVAIFSFEATYIIHKLTPFMHEVLIESLFNFYASTKCLQTCVEYLSTYTLT